MPQETLTFPPLYCIVGVYRLLHDPLLWKPMWAKCSKAVKHVVIFGLAWALLTWPIQRLFVGYFMSKSASVTGLSSLYIKMDNEFLGGWVPVPSWQTFATLMAVLGQVHTAMEFWLTTNLGQFRKTAYVETVRSRGKPADWWTEYVEEFANPPNEKAIKQAKKQGWYLKLASPIVRIIILKVFLLPMDFVPLVGMVIGAALRSLTYGRVLHKDFFEAKRMSPLQIELWVTERQSAYRSFGFVAALMERIPLIGLVFSVSNRIGAAMWAHDLEKRQQAIRSRNPSAQPLDEFKKKPTLKKIYKNVRDDVSDSEEAEGANFKGEGLAVVRRTRGGGGENAEAVFTNFSFTFPLKLISPGISGRNANRQLAQHHQQQQQQQERADGQAQSSTHAIVGSGGQDSVNAIDAARVNKAVAVMYIVGYGGGLVSGDRVDLDVDVGQACSLLILTQGSTKVFKTRTTRPTQGVSTATFPGAFGGAQSATDTPNNVISQHQGGAATNQTYRYLIRSNATLVLLPDPVTCFAGARYDQVQRFDLRDTATSSLIVLDWLTPGRTAVAPQQSPNVPKLDHLDSHPPPPTSSTRTVMKDYSSEPRSSELWSLVSYRSRNEIRSSASVIARDVLLLSQDPTLDQGLEFTELARRNHPFGCYATLLLAGPDADPCINGLKDEFQAIQQRPTTTTKLQEEDEKVLWSLSELERGLVVVRIAADQAQTLRRWLFKRLAALQNVVGTDLYRQALAS